MKKMARILLTTILFMGVILTLSGCGGSSTGVREASYDIPEMVAAQNVYSTPWPSGLKKTLLEEAGGVKEQKPYTLMLYVNGSNLESESGCATADINEMLDSDFDPDKVNVVIYAGGTSTWETDSVTWADPVSGDSELNSLPDGTSGIFTIVKDGGENKLQVVNYDISASNGDNPLIMMDGGTLAGFIDYAKTEFPAERYGLLFWNHGSGALVGYGYDELLDEEDPRTSMNLMTMKDGVEKGGTQFDLVGYDACLMSNLETALAIKGNAKVMVASQELEPGTGWSYDFLKELSDNPAQDPKEVGKTIVDYYNNYYKKEISPFGSSLAVTDLTQTDNVMNALSNLTNACTGDIVAGNFTALAKARDNTETFGSSDARSDKYEYMTDLGDIANELSGLHPAETQALQGAVKQAVVYSKTTDFDTDEERPGVNGLSVYYPYAYDTDDEMALYNAMKGIGVSEVYTNYLNGYSDVFYGGSGNVEVMAQTQEVVSNAPVEQGSNDEVYVQLSQNEIDNMLGITFDVWQAVDEAGMEDYYYAYYEDTNVEIDANGRINTEFDGYLPTLGGDYICLWESSRNDKQTIYSSPAKLNGKEVNLLITVSDEYPDGKILGAQPVVDETTGVTSRDIFDLKKGDKLVLEYYAEYLGEDETKEDMWYEGEEFTVEKDNPEITWVEVPENEVFQYGYCVEDVFHNYYYTDMIEIYFYTE